MGRRQRCVWAEVRGAGVRSGSPRLPGGLCSEEPTGGVRLRAESLYCFRLVRVQRSRRTANPKNVSKKNVCVCVCVCVCCVVLCCVVLCCVVLCCVVLCCV